MSATPFQIRVMGILSETLGKGDFAIGGGQALNAHKVINRLSDDIDTYTHFFVKEKFDDAESDLIAKLEQEGLIANLGKKEDVFRQMVVTNPENDESVVLDVGYDSRIYNPVTINGMAFLDLEDVVAGKARALYQRAAERDFYDIDKIISLPGWDANRVYAMVSHYFEDGHEAEFATLLKSSESRNHKVYRAMGMSDKDIKAMSERLGAAADAMLRSNVALPIPSKLRSPVVKSGLVEKKGVDTLGRNYTRMTKPTNT